MLFWKTFQSVHDEVFTRAVDSLIANEAYAPMLPTIQRAVQEADETLAKVLRPQFRKRFECNHCEDVGTTTETHSDGLRFAKPCDCPKGEPYRDAIRSNASRPAALKERDELGGK